MDREESITDTLSVLFGLPCEQNREWMTLNRRLIELLLYQEIRLDPREIPKKIEDPIQLSLLIRAIESSCHSLVGRDEIDETVFMKSTAVLTPLRFTPFLKQGLGNHKFRKVSTGPGDTQGLGNSFGSGLLPSQQQPADGRKINLGSRLVDSIGALSQQPLSVQSSALRHPGAVDRQQEPRPRDSFGKEMELYKWFREIQEKSVLKTIAIPMGSPSVSDNSNTLKLTEAAEELFKESGIRIESCKTLANVEPELEDWVRNLTTGEGDRPERVLKILLYLLTILGKEEHKKHGQNSLNRLLSERSFLKALGGLSIEIDGLVEEEGACGVETMLLKVDLETFDLWRVLVSVTRLISGCPVLLNEHLACLEMHLFLQLFWSRESPLLHLVKSMANIEEQDNNENIPEAQLTLSHGVFFRRLLQLIAERIFGICSRLNFNEKQMEMVWETMKLVICQQVDLLIGRHLDHSIVCSVYAVSKKTGQYQGGHKNFKEIFDAYERLSFTKNDINERNIFAGDGESPLNIKDFYNTIFVVRVKDFINKYNSFGDINPNTTPIRTTKKNILQKMQLDSPFRQALSSKQTASHLSHGSSLNGIDIPKPNPTLTPITQQLYAADSPPHQEIMLKKRMSSNKLINFDQLGSDTPSRESAMTPTHGNSIFGRSPSPKPGTSFLLGNSIDSLRAMIRTENLFGEVSPSPNKSESSPFSHNFKVEVKPPGATDPDPDNEQPGTLTPTFF